MNARKITRFYAAVMSVLMLQTVAMDLTLPVSANDNIEQTECTGLDMIPTSLRGTLEQELQNAIEIDKRTESDLFSIGTINIDGTRSLMTFSDRGNAHNYYIKQYINKFVVLVIIYFFL